MDIKISFHDWDRQKKFFVCSCLELKSFFVLFKFPMRKVTDGCDAKILKLSHETWCNPITVQNIN